MTEEASGLEASVLAPSAQETLKEWHRFVETQNADVLRPLFAETTVFRSPFVHLPIPGRPASLLILTTVVKVFENSAITAPSWRARMTWCWNSAPISASST